MRVAWAGLGLVVLASCGEVRNEPEPAGATVGASTSSSAAGTGGGGPVLETIHVIDFTDRQPIGGVPVLVSDAAGDVRELVYTDDDGVATTDVPDGALVTIFPQQKPPCTERPSDCSQLVISLPGVEDGADLTVSSHRNDSGRRPPINEPMTIELAFDPVPAGHVMRVWFDCPDGIQSFGFCGTDVVSEGQTSHTIADYRGCPGSGTYDVYLFLLVSGVHVPIAAGAVLDQPLQPGGVGTHTVALDADSLASTTTTITGIPSDTEVGSTQVLGRRTGGCMVDSSFGLFGTSGRSAIVEQKTGTFFDEVHRGEALSATSSQGKLRRAHGSGWKSTLSPMSWVADELAGFAGLEREETEDGRPSLSWTLTEEGALGDGLDLAVNFALNGTHWRVLAPAVREGFVAYPKLPPELAAYGFGDSVPDLLDGAEGEHADALAATGFAEWLVSRGLYVESSWTKITP